MGRLAVAVIVSSWVIPLSILVNRIVPDPYMDEIFHVPQAQKYCDGNFRSWDPMITTPPGLYYLSLAHVASLFPGLLLINKVESFSEGCSTAILRSSNGMLAVLCSILVYEIIISLRPIMSDRKATLISVVLAMYPLHWFFSFLYYTDVASLTVVLAMYLASLKKKYAFSALLGALAVFIRQTNIIWMLFVACAGVIDMTLVNQRSGVVVGKSIVKNGQLSTRNNIAMSSNLRKRKSDNTVDAKKLYTHSMKISSPTLPSGLLDEIQAIILTSWQMKWELLVSFSPFLIVFMAFIAFVRWNGSVVLGAKEAHVVSPHFAQIMYFSLVSVLFIAPLHLNLHNPVTVIRSSRKTKGFELFLGFISLAAGFLSVHYFSIAHPYLLSDNRHYPFYLWRKVIQTHWSAKYLLVPLYVYSWFIIFKLLVKTQRKIWLLVYFLATVAVLVPAPLIEFRYYTIPFYFLVLHCDINSYRGWFLLGIMFLVVNVFTEVMFLFRPFSWSHEIGVQRFIW